MKSFFPQLSYLFYFSTNILYLLMKKVMRKIIIILSFLFVFEETFSQQTRIGRKNLEVNKIGNTQGTIDSLTIGINGNYSYATFYVTISTSANYYVGFWLMGHKDSNGNYSKYDLFIDGLDTGINVTSSLADWQLISLPNNGKVSLTAGNHLIGLRGTKSDIPNVEELKLDNLPIFFMNTDNTRYQYAKYHHSTYNHIIPTTIGSYTEINYNDVYNDSISPPSIYHGELNKNIFYTFYRLQYFEQGETVAITTDTIGSKHHYLHLISLSNPSNYSWVSSSSPSGHAILNLTIPSSGFYYVLVRTLEPEDWGTCNLSINGSLYFESVPIVNHLTEVPSVLISGRTYACFAFSSFINPMVWLIDNDYTIINFNDDYPYDANNSSYNWRKNARINQTLNSGMKVLATLEKSYQNGNCSATDIYASGRIRYNTYYDYFPELKQDDHIITGEAALSYNCMAWALGEWSNNFWFSILYGSSSGPYHVDVLDSVCAIYGYTRTGATEANALIDLWAIVENGEWDCKHFSVRKRAHKFAGSYDWESKLGGLERIMHPRNDLRSLDYGQIVAHYVKSNTIIGPGINDSIIHRQFENVSFTDKEINLIQNGISQIPENVKTNFLQLYESCQKEGMEKLTLFIDVFQKVVGYEELIRQCKDNPLLQFLIFKKIDEGDVLAIQLMEDLIAKPNIQLFKKVQAESSKRNLTKDGYRIVRTLQANSMLFVKAYLSTLTKSMTQENTAITYSNSDVFHASVSGKMITLSINLKHDAYLSAIIGNSSGSYINNIVIKKHYE